MTKTLTVLGSTGSVGKATLDVVRANPGEFDIQVLTAHKNVELLAAQAKEFKVRQAVIADDTLYESLKALLSGTDITPSAGSQAVIKAAGVKTDITMAAIVGMVGLESLLAAVENGGHVAIANKEPLVAAGALVMSAAKKSGATILPVDSEHNAIFQSLEERNRQHVRRLILTASGGPFREWTEEQMAAATPAQALAHPNWSMGAKISIDSATMMNKALEVIEAHYLFDMPPERIDVMVHPQSVVHSMVEYTDGSVLSQMGPSDMRVPIAHALAWPARIKNDLQPIDFTKISSLTFEPVDHRRFPAINLAYYCLKAGQAACIAFNAANEVAVSAFLKGEIGFSEILYVVQDTVCTCGSDVIQDLETILAFDEKMRHAAQNCIVKERTRTRKAL